MKTFTKLAVTSSSAAFSLAALMFNAGSATAFQANFEFNSTGGVANDAFGSGTLIFDDASLTGSGIENISLNTLSSPIFNFTFGTADGITYDETGVQGSPVFSFLNGSLIGASFTAKTLLTDYPGSLLTVSGTTFTDTDTEPGQPTVLYNSGNVIFKTVQPVPEPDTISVSSIVLAGALSWLLNKKRVTTQKTKS